MDSWYDGVVEVSNYLQKTLPANIGESSGGAQGALVPSLL